jgi:acetyl-CoA carboxylase carboxyl transferase subunit beta
MPLFGRKYTEVTVRKAQIPEGLWTRCEECGKIIYNKALEESFKVCPKCQFHFTIGAPERINLLMDGGTFQEFDADLLPVDSLQFKGPKAYSDKIKEDQKKTGLKEAALSGEGKIEGRKIILAVTDSRFIGGSMGAVVGEKITRAIERSAEKKLPLVIVSGSGGGARMYEGIFSLMQMAKTSAALARHQKVGVPYISVLTHQTMAGVLASFASLGDVIVAEPKALIGFTGPRVIEQTIRQKLPEGFQRSEFLLEHGLIDLIIHRKEMKTILAKLIDYLG